MAAGKSALPLSSAPNLRRSEGLRESFSLLALPCSSASLFLPLDLPSSDLLDCCFCECFLAAGRSESGLVGGYVVVFVNL